MAEMFMEMYQKDPCLGKHTAWKFWLTDSYTGKHWTNWLIGGCTYNINTNHFLPTLIQSIYF